MILVEIGVAANDKNYQVKINENANIKDIINDVLCVISKKEHIAFENIDDYELFGVDVKKVYDKEKTVAQQNISMGDRLVII